MAFVHLLFTFQSLDLFYCFTLVYEGYFVSCYKEKLELVERAMANFKRRKVCMISAVICVSLHWVWHLYNLPCASALFWLISIARYVFKSPRICFWGTKYYVYCGCVAYLHSLLWRRAWLWLELFASTVGRFLSRISCLPSYVFLLRRRT